MLRFGLSSIGSGTDRSTKRKATARPGQRERPIQVSPRPARCSRADQGYGRGGTPIFTDVFEPLARVALYPTDEDGLGTCFGAA